MRCARVPTGGAPRDVLAADPDPRPRSGPGQPPDAAPGAGRRGGRVLEGGRNLSPSQSLAISLFRAAEQRPRLVLLDASLALANPVPTFAEGEIVALALNSDDLDILTDQGFTVI